MQVGNQLYDGPEDLPDTIPVFPLGGALMLPRGQLPLNIFEPRYLKMIDDALSGDRLIGMIQPQLATIGEVHRQSLAPPLEKIGCVGRLTQWAETGDGRYHITITGLARFKILAEVPSITPYRICQITAADFPDDFVPKRSEVDIDRKSLLAAVQSYLEAQSMEADWDSVGRASNELLVNALAMMIPFGPAEKQALLEAIDLKTRADTLIAITERSLARQRGNDTPLQ